ncbi:hypothetical protein B0I27_107118 [Arcticibacter pallidicorallinus]|uniref:Uncharacterized protein n=2 Tax=Arcticibacter pallidicorallinus TaxID=1259464 RepID=A0A2T0U0V4_9SPHI|nr:hypothetical protein B0I27_107118 [Arcticibacter pallidicorallinus]
MPNMPKLPFAFPDFVKYPLQGMLYLLLGYFVYKEFTKKDECADLRVTVKAQALRIVEVEKRNDDLTWAIAVKSGIIDELRSKKDSTTKESKNENN